MGQPIKLQINSIEAIERLIGGNSGIEIEIRNSVVQGFANKHLRGLATELLGTVTERGIRDAIQNEVLEKVDSGASWLREMREVLRQPIQQAIKKQVDILVKEEISKAVYEARQDVYKRLDECYKELAIYITENTQPRIAEDVVQQLAYKKINALLAEQK